MRAPRAIGCWRRLGALAYTRSFRAAAVIGTSALVLAYVGSASAAHPGRRSGAQGINHRRLSTKHCIPYRTTDIPAGTRCMVLPWQIEGAGTGSRWVDIALAPACLGFPYWTLDVTQTKTAIAIRAFGWLLHDGANCGENQNEWGAGARLSAPIDGREIKGASWPTPLRFGTLSQQVYGLPRLLGLSPRQAVRTLWLEGFRSRLLGKGREIVSQVPGWELAAKGSRLPAPYSGVTKLVAGSRIEIPTTPRVRPGTPSGLLIGAIRDGYGDRVAGTIALFDARGRLRARFRVALAHSFRLRVAPGRYELLDDSEGGPDCPPPTAVVHAHHTTRVTVSVGCDIPY